MKPRKLSAADKANFETLKRAVFNGDLALVSTIRKRDKKHVALVCVIERDDEMFNVRPLAIMLEGNPYDDFEDPTL